MTKSNSKSNKSKSVDSQIPFPHKHTFDELAVVDDSVLSELSKSLTDSVSRAHSHGLNPYSWEVELCYVQRELQIRSVRREAHSAYLARVPAVEVD